MSCRPYFTLVLFLLAIGCREDETIVPLSCDAFGLLTPTLDEDADGKLQAHVALTDFNSFDGIEGHGLQYRIVGAQRWTSISITTSIESGEFGSIDQNKLPCGLTYELRAFITTNETTCVSQSLTFNSPESLASPWCGAITDVDGSRSSAVAVTINGRAFILYSNRLFFEVDLEERKLIPRANFPSFGIGEGNFAGFSVGQYGYFLRPPFAGVYRYDSENDTWTSPDNNLFMILGQNFVGAAPGNNIGYFLDTWGHGYGYTFNPAQDEMVQELAGYNDENIPDILRLFQNGNDIYVLTDAYSVYKLNPNTYEWEYVTTYPGRQADQEDFVQVAAFAVGSKAYMGLAYVLPLDVAFREANYDMFELDLNTGEWKELAEFPMEFVNWSDITCGSADGKGFMVFEEDQQGGANAVMLWTFDPEKTAYK